MTVSENLLTKLRCMKTCSPLSRANAALVSDVNDAIRAGQACDMLGRTIDTEMDAALINAERTVLYPVFNGVLQMLLDEVVDLKSVGIAKNWE